MAPCSLQASCLRAEVRRVGIQRTSDVTQDNALLGLGAKANPIYTREPPYLLRPRRFFHAENTVQRLVNFAFRLRALGSSKGSDCSTMKMLLLVDTL